MTTDREILEKYRAESEQRIKDLFIWTLGESAITEMTRTVRDNHPNRMDINQLYSSFRLHFIPERVSQPSRLVRHYKRERRQINQNSTRFTKIERNNHKTKCTNAKHGRTNFKNLKKKSEREDGGILATKLDFDYAYGQIKLDEKTRNLCIFSVTGGEFTGYYRFVKGFYGLADIPTIFQERIDKTLKYKHPAWLGDIIKVTKGDAKKHEAEVGEIMKELENAGYRLNPKKCEVFKREIGWDIKLTNKEYDHYKINWKQYQK